MATRRKSPTSDGSAAREPKAPPEPVTIDERPLDEQEPPPSLEALAEALRRLGMSPEAVLERAILGEVALRDLQPNEIERQTELSAWRFISGPLRPLGMAAPSPSEVLDALEGKPSGKTSGEPSGEPSAMFSVRVAEVVTEAARRCYYASADSKVRRPKAETAFLLSMAKTLTRSHPLSGVVARVNVALPLARELDETADRIAQAMGEADASYSRAQPQERALARVAKRHGTTSGALKAKIKAARKSFPSAPWPKKKARRP